MLNHAEVNMCGILFSNSIPADPDKYLSNVRRFIRHRGIHEPSFYAVRGMLFAHSLMPVQGTSPVMQPITKDNSVLIFSGELWKHDDCSSDTLFLFNVLAQSDDIADTLSEAQGMFALVFYNGDSGSVYFASDVFGEIPLYFSYSGPHLQIASEIKQLVALGESLKNVHPALPGTLYVYDPEQWRLTTVKYHEWQFQNEISDLRPELVRALIEESVREKYTTIDLQRSALLLSGGLDSTILAYELSKLGLRETFTVVADDRSRDLEAARSICDKFGMNFNPIIAHELNPDCAIAVTEVSNRSIIEEMCCHLALGNTLRDLGIRVVFTGCGADEIFVGYQHLLRYRSRETRRRLQEEFVTNYHRMDLRAFNKAYMLNAIELRNPFLSPKLLEYAATLDVDSLLIGRHREMKLALRLAYTSVLGDMVSQPKLIARETMGAKRRLLELYGDSPHVYRGRFKEIFGDPDQIAALMQQAQTLH